MPFHRLCSANTTTVHRKPKPDVKNLNEIHSARLLLMSLFSIMYVYFVLVRPLNIGLALLGLAWLGLACRRNPETDTGPSDMNDTQRRWQRCLTLTYLLIIATRTYSRCLLRCARCVRGAEVRVRLLGSFEVLRRLFGFRVLYQFNIIYEIQISPQASFPRKFRQNSGK